MFCWFKYKQLQWKLSKHVMRMHKLAKFIYITEEAKVIYTKLLLIEPNIRVSKIFTISVPSKRSLTFPCSTCCRTDTESCQLQSGICSRM